MVQLLMTDSLLLGMFSFYLREDDDDGSICLQNATLKVKIMGLEPGTLLYIVRLKPYVPLPTSLWCCFKLKKRDDFVPGQYALVVQRTPDTNVYRFDMKLL